MREDMLNAGYLWDGITWTSPFSGRVTSYQPAREEYLMVMALKPELRENGRELERVRAQLKDSTRRCRELSALLAERDSQLAAYEEVLRRIAQALVGWTDEERHGLLEEIGSLANTALAQKGQAPPSRGCRDDSCDAAHCPRCGCHKLDWYAPGWCRACVEAMNQ